MNLNPNLKFDEIMYRYGILIVLGIVAGITHQYWMAIIANAVFLTALLGWCPLKAVAIRKREKVESKQENIVLRHRVAH